MPAANLSTGPVPSCPGFGYLFISTSYSAKFQEVGDYFFLSYLPKGFPEEIDKLQVCLWLGSEHEHIEMVVFLIWPGKGILSFGAALTSKSPSRLIHLGTDVGSFETHPPNTVVKELLYINQKPCILFIKWPALHTLVTDDASQLSFTALAQNWINDLCQFLEDTDVNLGDAVPASKFQEWYSLTLKCLREADPKRYLFDPTLFLARLLIHLRSTLYTVNHFDINGATKSGGAVFVPLCFIRCWKEELLSKLYGDLAILRELISD